MFTHKAFTDESCYNSHQFRSLSLVTVEKIFYEKIKSQIKAIYSESNVSVLEWKKIESAKDRFCAIKLLDLIIQSIHTKHLRIDIVFWDIHDERHAIPGRDDIENLKRMFYHLLSNTLKHRWPDDKIWKIVPDENTAIDWTNVKEILSTQEAGFHNLDMLNSESFLHEESFPIIIREYFKIHELEEGKSHEEEFLQIADVFAGMAAFSRNNYKVLSDWISSKGDDSPALFEIDSLLPHSKRDVERFRVINHFNRKCKENKLGVSLKSFSGLRTLKPENPINFWWYEPQSEFDRAPLRSNL